MARSLTIKAHFANILTGELRGGRSHHNRTGQSSMEHDPPNMTGRGPFSGEGPEPSVVALGI